MSPDYRQMSERKIGNFSKAFVQLLLALTLLANTIQ